jgi:hypothetical protein
LTVRKLAPRETSTISGWTAASSSPRRGVGPEAARSLVPSAWIASRPIRVVVPLVHHNGEDPELARVSMERPDSASRRWSSRP